jgi:hypothetical protein
MVNVGGVDGQQGIGVIGSGKSEHGGGGRVKERVAGYE